MCILDFSGTLIANGNIAPQAKQAVHTCVESGQKIGVVSSSDNVEFLRKTLQSIDGQVFDENFFRTPGFQPSTSDKAKAIRDIMFFHKVSPDCTVYVDDAPENPAKRTGVAFIKVNSKRGVTKEDVQKGISQMRCRLSFYKQDWPQSPQQDWSQSTMEINMAPQKTKSTSAWMQPDRQAQRACVFATSVLRSAFFSQAVEICNANGLGVGILVDSNQNLESVKTFLNKVNPAVFSPNFFSTPAFQVADIDEIKLFFGAAPGCTLLFDNLPHTENVIFQKVGDAGLMQTDFDAAWIKMDAMCKYDVGNFRGVRSSSTQHSFEPSSQPVRSIACPDLYFPPSSHVMPSQCVNKQHGDSCDLKCEPGWGISAGRSRITCVDGEWSDQPLSCQATLDTKIPAHVNRPEVTYSGVESNAVCPPLFFRTGSIPNSCENYGHEQVCHIKCAQGFQAVAGTPLLTCLFGEWSGGQPLVCQPDLAQSIPSAQIHQMQKGSKCPDLFLSKESHVNPSSCVGKMSGDSCEFMCAPGFKRFVGDGFLKCNNGIWSGPPLQCVPSDSGVFQQPTVIRQADSAAMARERIYLANQRSRQEQKMFTGTPIRHVAAQQANPLQLPEQLQRSTFAQQPNFRFPDFQLPLQVMQEVGRYGGEL